MLLQPFRCNVIVGNIGTVSHHVSRFKAGNTFHHYVAMSKANYGVAAGESVVLVDAESGDIIEAYYPPKACGADSL